MDDKDKQKKRKEIIDNMLMDEKCLIMIVYNCHKENLSGEYVIVGIVVVSVFLYLS